MMASYASHNGNSTRVEGLNGFRREARGGIGVLVTGENDCIGTRGRESSYDRKRKGVSLLW
jgi:hypothetical protein